MKQALILACLLWIYSLPHDLRAQEDDPGPVFSRAYQLFTEGKSEQAEIVFFETLNIDFPLEDYSLYYLGVISSNRGNFEDARNLFSQLRLRFPQSLWFHRAELQLAKNLIAEEKLPEARQILTNLRTDKSVKKAVSEEAGYLLARISETEGQVTRAFSLYRELREAAPLSPWAASARKEIHRLRTKWPERFPLASPEALWQEAELLTRERQYREAEKIYQKLLELDSAKRERPRYLFGLARAYLAHRRRQEAIPHLTEIVRQYPKSPEASGALYRWAWILWNRNENERALSLFKQLIEHYPNNSFLETAHLASGRIYESLGKQDEAIASYKATARKFRDGRTWEEAQWRLAWIYYLSGYWNAAYTTFKSIAAKKGEGRFQTAALYWQARSTAKLGTLEEAKQIYINILRAEEDSYYKSPATRDLEKMGAELPQDPMPGIESSVSLTPLFNAAHWFHLTRARELERMELNQLAIGELDEIHRLNDKDLPLRMLLMREYARNRAYARSVALAQTIPDLSEERSRHLYPLAYWAMIQQKANERELDPFLVLALIRQESLFDPRARSSASALGLMQLLPSTASRVANQNGLELSSEEKLFEPELNLTLGISYLKELLGRYSNNLVKAIAAYNAGENAVARWEGQFPGDDIEEFIERIPYGETRLYVKLVLRNLRTYKLLYDNPR